VSNTSFRNVETLRLLSLVITTAIISLLFFSVVQGFVISLFLAAVTAALARPLYLRIQRNMPGQRAGPAAGVTLVVLAVSVIAPVLIVIYLAAVQASGMAESVREMVVQIETSTRRDGLPEWVPMRDQLTEAWPRIVTKMGDITQAVAGYFVTAVSSMTRGAAGFFLHMFLFFYALLFFITMEKPVMKQMLHFSGLPQNVQDSMHERMVSISRATIKGTLTIGVIQGALGGLSFWVAGIDGVAFWAAIMTILAVIPGVGAPAIIFAAAAYLAIEGETVTAIALVAWAVVVVGTVDNILRPILVGRDAKLHDVMILISTLGGLGAFGAAGLVIGPVLAGLFVAIWSELSGYVSSQDTPTMNEQTPGMTD